jgi:hypothetical protein
MKHNWIQSKEVVRKIGDVEVKFRKVPIGTLQKCRNLNEDVARFVGMLCNDKKHDIEVEQITAQAGGSSYKQSAAQPSIISLRKTQTEEGIKGLLNAMTCDSTIELLSEIIVKSAYEEFTESDIPTLKDSIGVDDMIEFLKGAFEASAGDYAKLGKSLFQKNPKMQEIVAKLRAEGVLPEEKPVEVSPAT